MPAGIELPANLLNQLSALSTPVIVGAALLHLLLFFWLRLWASRDLRRMAADLDSFTRDLKNRSVLERRWNLADQIDAFLADVRETLDDPQRQAHRAELAQRIRILDENRSYLLTTGFETTYNIARTMIEAYPLAGILGTVLAIGAALQTPEQADRETVTAIVRNFGQSIWATFAGLMAAIVLMFLNSMVEPTFLRLSEQRQQVRETVARAKRELSLSARGDTP